MGQISRGLGIQPLAQLLVLLGLVHGGVGGAVHNAVDVHLLHEVLDGVLVGDVQLGHVGVEVSVGGVLALQQLHLVAQLAVASSNQYVHGSFFYR